MSPTEVDAISASYAEGRRDERETWRREVEGLRGELLRRDSFVLTSDLRYAAEKLDALLARLVPGEAPPAGPDLRAMVLALEEAEQALTWAQYSGRRKCGYCNKRDTDSHAKGCWIHDTIERVRATLASATETKSAAPAAPKAEEEAREGSWTADDPRRWFVDGAKWWEFRKTGATMWQSDRNEAEAEADRRKGGEG